MWDSHAEADRWLRQAANDLEFGRLGMREGYYSQTCFLAQQCAEKAVKAIGYSLGNRTVLGHSATVLADRYSADVPELVGLRPDAAILDQYYIPTRYPDGLPGGVPFMMFGEGQAREAIAAADRILALAQRVAGGTEDR